MKHLFIACIVGGLLLGCDQQQQADQPGATSSPPVTTQKPRTRPATPSKPSANSSFTPLKAAQKTPQPSAIVKPKPYRLVRVFVALCDNKYQGIVRVPAALGNGQSPKTNLYWGAMYGIKTFFRRSAHWKSESKSIPKPPAFILDQAYFSHSPAIGKPVHVHAIAIDGRHMKTALSLFLKDLTTGHADMVCFIGHNGLMDVQLDSLPQPNHKTPAIILACQSERYFRPILSKLQCPLLVSTSGNMAPEAYTLDAALRQWAVGKPEKQLRQAAAQAYEKYQKCSLRAAQWLFGAK